jgi:hypothetical protein
MYTEARSISSAWLLLCTTCMTITLAGVAGLGFKGLQENTHHVEGCCWQVVTICAGGYQFQFYRGSGGRRVQL